MEGACISLWGQLSKNVSTRLHIKIHESASASSCCSGVYFITDGSCYVSLFLFVLKAENVAVLLHVLMV